MSSTISDIQPTASTPRPYAAPERSLPDKRLPFGAVLSPYQVTLSNEARNLSAGIDGNRTEGIGSSPDAAGTAAPSECQTCSNRKYVDVSGDSTVSFQTPTKLAPGSAESMVRAHEQEHVTNEQARAEEQGKRVVSQTVTMQYAICPECGRSYVAGGTTTTVTKSGGNQRNSATDPRKNSSFNVFA